MEQVSGESTDHPHQHGVWIGAEHLNDADFFSRARCRHHQRRSVASGAVRGEAAVLD